MGILLFVLVATVSAEVPDLRAALGLTDSQIRQLQQKPIAIDPGSSPSAGRRPLYPSVGPPKSYSASLEEALPNPILDATQQVKLAAIVKVLSQWNMASEAVAAGLMDIHEWPGPLCIYPIRVHASELDLTVPQVLQSERLQVAARAPLAEEIANLARRGSDTSKLYQRMAETRAPRDLALAVLDDAQKAKLVAFKADLKLFREAIEIGLIPNPPQGENLCQ